MWLPWVLWVDDMYQATGSSRGLSNGERPMGKAGHGYSPHQEGLVADSSSASVVLIRRTLIGS